MSAAESPTFPPTGPMPIAQGRAPWSDTLSSLRVPNFRLFTLSNVVAMAGTWMQRITQDWLVLELTGSVAAVGITVALQFTPMLVFGLWGGVIVDRYSKRMLLMVTQGATGLLSAVLAVLALTGVIQAWHVFLIAFLVGMVTVVDNPTRQVFVNELVGPKHLRNAISVNSSVFQLGGLIGPALAGVLLVAVGAGWAFAINAATCVVTVVTLSRLKTSALVRSAPTPRAKGQLREGLVYVFQKPAILWTIVMVCVLSTFALTMPVILTSYANDVFDVGAAGYGIFNTLVAIGALSGAIASTRRASVRLRTVIVAGGAWGLLQLAAAIMPSELTFGILLISIGVADLLCITAANSLIQMSSNMGIRGRVMSVYVIVLLGSQAVGGPIMGWLVEHYGPHFGMAVSGVIPLLAAIAIGVHLARRGHLSLRVSLRRSSPFVAIVGRA
nr:MFS transporter [Glaciihabitans sp. dw_435]